MRFTINEDIYSDLKNKINLETRHRGQTSLKKFLCDLFGIPRNGTLLHHLNGDWDDLRPKNLALILTINNGKSNILHKLIHSLTRKNINDKKSEEDFSLEKMSVEQARQLLTDTLKNNLDQVMEQYPGNIILVQEKMKELNLDEQLLTNFTEQMKNENRTRRTTMLQEDNLSKNLSIEDIAKKHNVSVKYIEKQVEKGIKVEKEHTSNEEQAKRIALDHLFEIPDYYDRLHKMEKGALKESLLPKDITIDGSLLVDDGVDIQDAYLEDSITDWIYDQYGVGFQDYDYTVGDDGYVYVTNIKWDIDSTDSPLCVCKNCLMGIEAKEGPQKTHKVFFDDNDGICQWCGEGGFYVLYEFGEGEDRYFDESLTEDTVKQGNHWVNKGKEGTHGKFKTKKEADAQRKAMFAQGYKEGLNERFTNINGYYPDFCKTLDAHLNKIGFNVDVKNFASVIYIRVKKIEDTKKVTDYIKSLFDKYDIDPDITEDASEGSIMIDNLKQKTPLTVKATTMQPNHNARTQTQDNRKTITVESLTEEIEKYFITIEPHSGHTSDMTREDFQKGQSTINDLLNRFNIQKVKTWFKDFFIGNAQDVKAFEESCRNELDDYYWIITPSGALTDQIKNMLGDSYKESLKEEFDDEYDDFELSGIYGGDMTYCPICGARLIYREDGTHECPSCQEDAFTLAQERRKRDKEELDESIHTKYIIYMSRDEYEKKVQEMHKVIDEVAKYKVAVRHGVKAIPGAKSNIKLKDTEMANSDYSEIYDFSEVPPEQLDDAKKAVTEYIKFFKEFDPSHIEIQEGLFNRNKEDKETLKNFKGMLAHLKDKTNTAQRMSDITDKELNKAAKKAVKKYGPPSQKTLDYLAQRAKERGFTEGLEDKEYDCVLCGKHFTGWGNDPWPVAEDGRCCDKCNMEKVLPARINLMKSHKNESLEERVITPTDTLEGVKKDFIEDETNEFVRSFYTGGDHYVVYRSDKGLYTLIRSLPWDDFEIVFQTSNRKELSDKIDEIYEFNADYDLNL